MKNFISLDLELAQPSNRIIQIGAVAFQFEPFLILEKLSVIVNPQEQLSPFIIQLTGITQEMVDNGVDLQIAYGKLCELKIKYDCESYPVTWGGDDSKCVREQVEAGGNTTPFIFGRRIFDAKTLYQAYKLANGEKTQAGLKKACGRMGVLFEGPAHDALQDAINTAKIFKRLTNLLKMLPVYEEKETKV